MRNRLSLVTSIILCLIISSCTPSINVYEEVFKVENLAELNSDWSGIMFSSYDRKGGNDDGFAGTYSKLRIENGNSVLAETTGAGYISRIWFTHSEHKKDGLLKLENEHIKIYIDDKNIPAIDIPLEEIFEGDKNGFPAGLVGQGLGGWYCYVPVPFSKYCRVEVEGDGVRFYQINMQKYTGAAIFESYHSQNAEDVNRLLELEGKRWIAENHLTSMTKNAQSLKLLPYEKKSIVIKKEGVQISELQVYLQSEFINSFLNSKIRIYYDNEELPSVDVMANMFFAIPDSSTMHQSMFAGYSNGTFYNKFPMPFNEQVEIEFETGLEALELSVLPKLSKRSKGNWGYLKTFYNEESPIEDTQKDYLLMIGKGQGKYVGTFLMTNAKTHGEEHLPIWLEGDEVFTCDGEMRIHGTGTEDYFNCGWYSVPGRLNNSGSFSLHGFPKFEMDEIGAASAYRWHLTDPVPFNDSINVTIEHGTNNTVTANYKSVVFYYQQNVSN